MRPKQLVNRTNDGNAAVKRLRKEGKSTVKSSGVAIAQETPAKPRKTHRFKAGTVAIRDIKKSQKSTKPIFRGETFNRILRRIIDDELKNSGHHNCSDGSKNKIRFGEKVMNMFRTYTEAVIIKRLRVANMLAVFSKRVKVTSKDIETAECARDMFL
jgi:histone H3/H4